MIRKKASTNFVVEPSDYGWAVRVGVTQLGLFVTQRQALADVKRRQAILRGKSTLDIVGREGPEPCLRLPLVRWT